MLLAEKEHAITEVYSLASECSRRGWDGEDAPEIAPVVVSRAVEFLRAMPDDLPRPELAPEPDGSISLDWITSRTRFFSLSIGANDRIAYAFIDGTDCGHGVAHFDVHTILPCIVTGIQQIMNGALPD